MKIQHLFLSLAGCALVIASCQKPLEPELTVSPGDLTFEAAGGEQTVTVTANATWNATTPDAWVTVTPSTGSGNATVTIKVGETTDARSAKITFSNNGLTKYVSVSQKKKEEVKPDDPTPKPDAKPTSIKSAEDFATFAAKIAEYETTETVTLDADITISAPFAAILPCTFDGNNHTITINYNATEKIADTGNALDPAANIGVFNVVVGTVKNLKTAGSITVSPEAGSGTYHIGGICGIADGTAVFENCTNGIDLLANTQCTHHMGGIAGYTSAGAVIKGCTNNGKVEMIIPEKGASNASQLGGIVGHIEGKGDVEDCTNAGQVTYEGTGTPRIAGICGYFNNLEEGLFKNCTNNGPIVWNEGDYTKTSWSYVGGITGYYGTPKVGCKVVYDNCVNNGSITATITETKSKSRIGGIAAHGGIATSTVADDGVMDWELKNCVNNGEITSSSTTANNYLGGVFGYAEINAKLSFNGCANNGKISVAGKGSAGGILGRNCSVKSEFKDVKVGAKAVISAGEAEGCFVGTIIGWQPLITTAFTGKVAGCTVVKGAETTTITSANFSSFLLGKDNQALGEGGSLSGVSFGE